MTPDTQDGGQWDRVAAELRACRQTQKHAWGDIDNTTLGRFLAGEATPEEQQQIEHALDELPELRKLTDLVRDVLGESETAAPEPVSVPYGPAVLPFPQPQQIPSRSVAISARAEQKPTPPRERKPWYRQERWRQRFVLAAAACLLLLLGLTLPRPTGSATPEAGPSLAMNAPVAERTPPFAAPMPVEAEVIQARGNLALNPDAAKSLREVQDRFSIARMDASLQKLEAEGKKREADQLAVQYVNNLTRQALLYQETGDLESAEPVLNEACQLCCKTFGAEAPQTVRTRNSLAGVYEVALNTEPVSSAPASEKPLLRAMPTEAKDVRPGQTKIPRVMAMASPPPSIAPVRSESAYAAPAGIAHRGVSATYDAPHRGYKTTHSGGAKSSGRRHSNPTTANALRSHILHRTPQQIKTDVVPVLTLALREAKDKAERQRLANALAQLGPVAADAVPLLLRSCYRATDASEREILLRSLVRIGSPQLRSTLKPYLEQKDIDGAVQASRRFLESEKSK